MTGFYAFITTGGMMLTLLIERLFGRFEPGLLIIDCPLCGGYRRDPFTHEPCQHCEGKGAFVSVVEAPSLLHNNTSPLFP